MYQMFCCRLLSRRYISVGFYCYKYIPVARNMAYPRWLYIYIRIQLFLLFLLCPPTMYRTCSISNPLIPQQTGVIPMPTATTEVLCSATFSGRRQPQTLLFIRIVQVIIWYLYVLYSRTYTVRCTSLYQPERTSWYQPEIPVPA